MKIEVDPEFQHLLPPLAHDERERLMGDINKHGCRDPLVIWKEQNILMDGHNRYEICTDLNLPFKTTELSFPSRDDVKMWMFRNQLGRRNLTDFQRGEIALRMKPVIEAKAKENQRQSPGATKKGRQISDDLSPVRTDDIVATGGRSTKSEKPSQISDSVIEKIRTDEIVAKEAGVSRDTIRKVEKILEKATPEVIEQVRAGAPAPDGKRMTVNKAHQTITQPPRETRAVSTAPRPTGPTLSDWQRSFERFRRSTLEIARRSEIASASIVNELTVLIEVISHGK